jgi:aldehyde dehydrogenase (NAD+)
VSRFTACAKSLKWGNPREEDTIIGPVINERQHDKILGFLQKSVEQGAKISAGAPTASRIRTKTSSTPTC